VEKTAQGTAKCFTVIDDLLVYGSVISRPTGIQRVAAGIANALLASPHIFSVHVGSGEIRTAQLPNGATASWRTRLSEVFLRFLSLAPRSLQEAVRTLARTLLSRLASRRAGATVQPVAGDWLLVLGAPWIAPGMASAVSALAARHQLRVALLVHDLLPATDPQWFGDAQGVAARRDMETLIGTANLLFAVSNEVAHQVRKQTARPVHSVSPADPLFPRSAPRTAAGSKEQIVLTVGTLHPRKNLAALVRIWDQWIQSSEQDRSAADGPPRLIIAGRRHPQDAALFDALASHPRTRSRISLVHTADDAQLAELYATARFLVMPSLAEGWGMPVREALVAGIPSIVTDAVPAAQSTPYVKIVPAGDEVALGAAIHEWWDGAEPERLSAEIRQHFTPRTWTDVGREIEALLAQ